MEEYLDIAGWNYPPVKFREFWEQKMQDKSKLKDISPLNFEPVQIYALFQVMISKEPNGIFSIVGGYPIDRPIWWDFFCESKIGFIHIWRTSFMLEARFLSDVKSFNLETFLNYNLKKYENEIKEKINHYEKHSIYINHYNSYKESTEHLWEEIEKLDLTVPNYERTHLVNQKKIDENRKKVEQFINNSIKLHALGKSLILNSAFCSEALVNTLIRIGAKKDLLAYRDILKKHLNSNFTDRLKSLKYYSRIFEKDVDMDSHIIKEQLKLITLRNKYVHADESSEFNRVGEVFFDGLYPLYPVPEFLPMVESIIRTYHNPSFSLIKWAFETYKNFDENIKSLISPKFHEDVFSLLKQNQLGFNEDKKIYSSIFNDNSPTFFLLK